MKTKIIISFLFLLSISQLHGQAFFKSPKDINHAINRLNRKVSKTTKNEIKTISPDSLLHLYEKSYDELSRMDDWFFKWDKKGIEKYTRLEKYFKDKGLKTTSDMVDIVLRCFQLDLKGLVINHEEIIKPFQLRQVKYNQEDKIKFTTDSLRGIYIPKDIEDCFKSLDKIYSDSIKKGIINLTEFEYTSGNYSYGIGLWVRNYWRLWGGSRLSKYFYDLGVIHPDSMSVIIMNSYHRYLKKKEIKFDEQIESSQDPYWKLMNEKKKSG